jgi:hypothetical protein
MIKSKVEVPGSDGGVYMTVAVLWVVKLWWW